MMPSNSSDSEVLELVSEYMTATTCTLVIPINARKHPTIDVVLNILLKNIRERIAVNTILPPRDICHTELSTMFRAM